MRVALKHFALAISLAWLAGCATGPQAPVKREAATSPAFTEAHQLAQTDARGNTARIEALLASLDDAALSRHTIALAANDPLYPIAGRAMLNRGLTPPHPFDHGWKFDDRAPADRDGYRPPRKLAVLLPLSGSLAAAAKPVRDGLLAGYYAETRARPPIVFYDSAPGAMAAYQRAVGEGADFVIGPLDRNGVEALFTHGALPVPMLGLNRGHANPPAGSTSFSLAPEDEGVAAAEFLMSRKAPRVLVLLAAGDDTMRRTANAFRERLNARGGEVVEMITLAGDNAGLPGALAGAVAKGEINALYFAARGEQARAAMPFIQQQPALAGARRMAVSQIANGAGDAEQAALLDGIVFPSEALRSGHLPGLPVNPGALTPTARGAAGRLFAFGYDAWLITAYLERLANPREGGLAGATGTLRLDGFGNVLRTPGWSELRGGVAMPYGVR
ncbi:LppC family lipoprotein [Lysobacter pythonis]|uniref:LppC family lipoprotein n=1 Tax=Solilutibacter pythonis TaxID=2483112 RepID=A0A3M2HWV1_9GAMM|nr:penicillin-binding protein activator [Lysobacter pythonis]RMH94206.1 LppC family lipoprotein [Lysobacter pythonis]